MGTGLSQIREYMTEYLSEHGVSAVTAWGGGQRLRRDIPVVAVTLRGCVTGVSGFCDYLGERYDQDSQQWQELYGKRAKLTLGLDIYANGDAGEEEIQTAFDQLTQVLSQGCPDGVRLEELTCGETSYDENKRVLKRKVDGVCQVYLYAVTEPGGTFLDFEIKGGLKQ